MPLGDGTLEKSLSGFMPMCGAFKVSSGFGLKKKKGPILATTQPTYGGMQGTYRALSECPTTLLHSKPLAGINSFLNVTFLSVLG